jgi:alkylation response protein AidB-like acyl-CoA dehydrogenase
MPDNAGVLDLDRLGDFARNRIAPRALEMQGYDRPPADLWREMAEAGLFGLAIPKEYGGAGHGFADLARGVARLAGEGGSPGLVTSWLGHQLISRLHIATHGNEAQRRQFLPALASGELTPCLAISEPGAGAHPKRLATMALRDGDDVILNGEKAFLTNGPIAGLFLVLAITGEVGGRKQFTIFMVPRDTRGLEETEGVKVDFLKPSPHCGLRLTDCRIPAANRLGPEGGAFDAISLPMRRTEDGLFAASLAGTLRFLLHDIAASGGNFDDEGMAELGRLSAAPDGLLAMACQAMAMIDAGDPEAADKVPSIAAAARDWARALLPRVEGLIFGEASPLQAALMKDLRGLLSIARAAQDIQARKRAQSLLQRAAEN